MSANKTLIMQLSNELDNAIQDVGDIVATGPVLEQLNDVYERLQHALEIHRELYDRAA